jgi:hypothetical protein
LSLFAHFGPFRWKRYQPQARIRRSGGRWRWGEYGVRLQMPELVVAPREFDFPQVPDGAQRIYAGACVDQARREAPFDWRNIRKGKFLIYCSLGTYSQAYPHAKRLFSSVLETVKQHEDWQAHQH